MSARSDIAIIGMAARFAGAADLEAYWSNVLAKVDAVREASEEWSGPYFDPASSENDRIYTRKGGFLGDAVEFDPSAYGVMPSTVGAGDADHFLALEVTTQALEDAGYDRRPFDRSSTGVILGHGTYVNRGYDTLLQHGRVVDQTLEIARRLQPTLDERVLAELRRNLKDALPCFDAASIPGLVPNIIAGRIANRLDLQGPNFIVDAACASSLIAIEMAVRELTTGRCSMMLAGGVHSSTPPQLYMMFCLLQALSRSSVRPFDAAADGTLLGEGLGILVLKRLRDAEAAGDRIYAVIVGSGASSDGRAMGLLTPRREGQEIALRRAYEESGIEPASVELIEAHGTGTPVGDATELRSLQSLFGDAAAPPTRALGSVKSMIGHCISAAGAAGAIKTALALHEKVLPPTLCEHVNENLDCRTASFYVNNETRPWVRGLGAGPRRAGINAFGFGGVNAHLILEEYVGPASEEVLRNPRWPSELLVFSGYDIAELTAQIEGVRDLAARADAPSLASIARALASTPHKAQRAATICRDLHHLQKTLAAALEALKKQRTGTMRAPDVYFAPPHESGGGRIALLFPGEGAQYPNMLAELCVCIPSVRRWFDLLDDVFAQSGEAAPSLTIFPPPTCWTEAEYAAANARLFRFDLGSAAVFCASMALHELLHACGVRAEVRVGHSTGEGAALVAAGAINYESRAQLLAAMRTFYRRCGELERSGRIPEGQMLSVGALNPATLASILETSAGRVLLALDNSVNQSVLYCETPALGALVARIQELGGVCAKLPLRRAYHTPLFEQLRETIAHLYQELDLQAPRESVYSCATRQAFPSTIAEVRELAARQWFRPVHFRETVLRLYEEGIDTFIEVGPGAMLGSFVRDTLGRGKALALSCNHARRPALAQLQSVIAELYVRGAQLDFSPFYGCRGVPECGLDQCTSAAARPRMRLPLTMPQLRVAANIGEPAPPAAKLAADRCTDTCVSHASSERLAVRQNDPRTTAIKAHFETMHQFLATQRNVLERFGARSGASSHSVQSPAERSSDMHGWPLLGRVLERGEAHLRAERVFDLTRDRFLRDHALGSRLSTHAPQSIGLPVVPLTITMELAAQAAQQLIGTSSSVIAISNVRAHRWLALDDDTLRVEVDARMRSTEQSGQSIVQVCVRQTAEEGEHMVVFECAVLLSTQPKIAGGSALPDLRAPRSSNYSTQMLYGSGAEPDWRYAPMFHGPCFQGVVGIEAWDDGGIDALMVVRSPAECFTNTPDAEFLVDPVTLDCAGQLIGYWVAEQFGVDLTFFPFQVRQYEHYGSRVQPGARLRCRARIRLICDAPERAPTFEFVVRDPKQGELLQRADGGTRPPRYETCRLRPADAVIEADFEFLTLSGERVASLSGWRDRYFSIPHAHYRCQLWPAGALLSEPWLQEESGEIVRRVQAAPAYLDGAGQIWLRALARLVLTSAERDEWRGLPQRGMRRTQWLLGRVAAKDAVRQWARDRLSLDLAPIDIEVLRGPDGEPRVSITVESRVHAHVRISISHSDTSAAALACDVSEPKTGLDLETPARVRAADIAVAGFKPEELELLDALTAHERDGALVRIWCAKEAALKAAPSGLKRSPLDWTVVSYAHERGLARIVNGSNAFRARIFEDRGQILAVARACERDVSYVGSMEQSIGRFGSAPTDRAEAAVEERSR